MLAEFTSTWTGTPGSDTDICVPFYCSVRREEVGNSENSLSSYGDYMRYFNSIRGEKGGHYRTFKKIQALRTSLQGKFTGDVDPVQYLMHLYFEDKLSIADIFLRVQPMGMNYREESGLRKLFTDVFQWTLRDSSDERSRHTSKQVKADESRRESLSQMNQAVSLQKTEQFQELLSQILDQKPENPIKEGFDQETFSTLNYSVDRIIYLLECQEGISPEDLSRLQQQGIGTRTMARAIEGKINRICTELKLDPISIFPSTISRIIEKAKR